MKNKLLILNLLFTVLNIHLISFNQAYESFDRSSALVVLWITSVLSFIVLVRDLFEVKSFTTFIKLITLVNFITLIASGFIIVGF